MEIKEQLECSKSTTFHISLEKEEFKKACYKNLKQKKSDIEGALKKKHGSLISISIDEVVVSGSIEMKQENEDIVQQYINDAKQLVVNRPLEYNIALIIKELGINNI